MDAIGTNRENVIVGKDVIIEPSAILNGHQKITIGDGSWVGSYCNFRPVDNKITIGKNVLIGQLVSIITDSHCYDDVEQDIKDQGIYGADVIIKDNVWIGSNSVILHGVTLESGCIVAAGAVVTRSFPAHCMVAGNPANIIKRYSFKKKKWFKMSCLRQFFFKLGFL